MPIPKKAAERIVSGLKQYAPILQAQKDRDVSEADTVTVVKDMLADVFGFDKWAELTGEYAIRGTFCDLAIKIDGKLESLIEVKAIGLALSDRHVKQTVDYAANQGVDWVVLTNGIEWVLYHVLFKKPIDKEEVARVNLLSVNLKSEQELEKIFLLTKEAIIRDVRREYRDRKDATSHHMMAAIILNSEAILNLIRREVKQMSEIQVDRGIIEKVLREQVIKREALEGEQAEEAQKRYAKKLAKDKRQVKVKLAGATVDSEAPIEETELDLPDDDELSTEIATDENDLINPV